MKMQVIAISFREGLLLEKYEIQDSGLWFVVWYILIMEHMGSKDTPFSFC